MQSFGRQEFSGRQKFTGVPICVLRFWRITGEGETYLLGSWWPFFTSRHHTHMLAYVVDLKKLLLEVAEQRFACFIFEVVVTELRMRPELPETCALEFRVRYHLYAVQRCALLSHGVSAAH